jgi:hypothetical protein
LVTAINFLDVETAIFNGRSPSGKLLPTGVRLQPLGRPTRFASSSGVVCEKRLAAKSKAGRRSSFFIKNFLAERYEALQYTRKVVLPESYGYFIFS